MGEGGGCQRRGRKMPFFENLQLDVWLPSKFALVNSKEFRREVKDDRCYSQESLYSQVNNLVHLTKADDRRITRMKT